MAGVVAGRDGCGFRWRDKEERENQVRGGERERGRIYGEGGRAKEVAAVLGGGGWRRPELKEEGRK